MINPWSHLDKYIAEQERRKLKEFIYHDFTQKAIEFCVEHNLPAQLIHEVTNMYYDVYSSHTYYCTHCKRAFINPIQDEVCKCGTRWLPIIEFADQLLDKQKKLESQIAELNQKCE